MINGLVNFHCVRSGNSLMVQLPTGEYITSCGVRLKIGGYNNSDVVVITDDQLPLYKVTPSQKVLSHFAYEDENGATLEMSNEQMQNARKIILDPYLNQYGDPCYPDLDTEFRVRSQLRALDEYKAVYTETEEQHEKLTITEVGSFIDTGSEFITTPIIFGKATFPRETFFRLDQTGVVNQEFHKWIAENNLQDRTHNQFDGYVKFVKVNNEHTMYSFHTGTEKNSFSYYKTLEEAKNAEKRLRKQVRQHARLKVFGGEIIIDQTTIKEVSKKIDSVRILVDQIDPKAKTANYRYGALNKIREIEKLLLDSVDEND